MHELLFLDGDLDGVVIRKDEVERLAKLEGYDEAAALELRRNEIKGEFAERLSTGNADALYHLIDLSSYGFINNYTTTMLSEVDNEGGIYLLPSSFQMAGISHNKTLLEEMGWEVPSSFEELLELAPEIEAAGYDVMRCMSNLDGYALNYFFNILNTEYFYTSEGSQWKEAFSNGEAKAAGNEGLLEGVRYLKRWVDEGLIKASDFEAGEESKVAFMNGECAFFLSLGLTEYESITEDGRTYEFGVMPWLSENGTKNTLTTNTSCCFGLSKELLEPGNEQKLQDPLALIEFISTSEGQEALVAEKTEPFLYTAPLIGAGVPEDSPFAHLSGLVEEGRTVPLVYVGWEDLIVLIAQDVKKLIAGELTPEQLLEEFDATYEGVTVGRSSAIATAEEDMDWGARSGCAPSRRAGRPTPTPRWCPSAGTTTPARSTARTSIGTSTPGTSTRRPSTCSARRYEEILVLEMTGAEIKALAEGGFDIHGTGNPFPYALVVKGDAELDDDAVYRLAIGDEEAVEEVREQAVERVDVGSQQAVIDYLSTLGSFSSEDIVWE